jgi:hypothetical protein
MNAKLKEKLTVAEFSWLYSMGEFFQRPPPSNAAGPLKYEALGYKARP